MSRKSRGREGISFGLIDMNLAGVVVCDRQASESLTVSYLCHEFLNTVCYGSWPTYHRTFNRIFVIRTQHDPSVPRGSKDGAPNNKASVVFILIIGIRQ